MAMYYYASKLNEASCSGCDTNVPPAPSEPAPLEPALSEASALEPAPTEPAPSEPAPVPPTTNTTPLPSEPTLLHGGSGLSYYDNDDYYSMIRGNKFVSASTIQTIVMNSGGINFVSANPMDTPQLSTVILPSGVRAIPLPYVNCPSDKPSDKPSGKPSDKTSDKLSDKPSEKPDVEYRDGQIVSATFKALVDMLRPGASKEFTFTFLLCARLYVKPDKLLNKLCKRYYKCYDKIGKISVKEQRDREITEITALVRVLRQWVDMFPYDFRDDRVMALVRNITQRCAAYHMGVVRAEMSALLEKLLDKLTALEHYEETLVEVPQVTSVDQLTQGDILTLGLTPVELANQLTIVEQHRLSHVGPEEFVLTFAPPPPTQSSSTCGVTSITLVHLETKSTRNLEAYADWFNRLSYLVATDILKAPKSKYRARVIEQWVMTARECFNLGNFNSLMAIISALNMLPVIRLKKTWSRTSAVCGQQLRQLELCVEPGGNHARYRAALAAAPTETAVPLLSVTCRDLHFANQGAPTKFLGNRVNFEKCSLLARHVNTQLASRKLMSDGTPVTSHPSPHMPVWRFLNDRPTLTEMALELTSFDCEPPADNQEKERLKRLRGGV